MRMFRQSYYCCCCFFGYVIKRLRVCSLEHQIMRGETTSAITSTQNINKLPVFFLFEWRVGPRHTIWSFAQDGGMGDRIKRKKSSVKEGRGVEPGNEKRRRGTRTYTGASGGPGVIVYDRREALGESKKRRNEKERRAFEEGKVGGKKKFFFFYCDINK